MNVVDELRHCYETAGECWIASEEALKAGEVDYAVVLDRGYQYWTSKAAGLRA